MYLLAKSKGDVLSLKMFTVYFYSYSILILPSTECGGVNFFKSVVQALTDFKELCPVTPLMMLFEVGGKNMLLSQT